MKSTEQRLAALEKKVARIEKLLASKHSKQYDEDVNEMQSKGGKARAAKLSDERRREIASSAAKAMWAKRGKTRTDGRTK